jgi:hypothetical protein
MKVWQEHEHIFSVKSFSNWGWSHWDMIGEKIPVLMHSRHGVVSLAYFFCRVCTLALYVVGFLVFFLRVCFRLCKYKFLFMQTENMPKLINHVIPKLCKSKLHKSEQHLFKYLFDIRICWKWNVICLCYMLWLVIVLGSSSVHRYCNAWGSSNFPKT